MAVCKAPAVCMVCWLLLHCRALGNVPGVPKVHYKGRQGDFYIMVRLSAFSVSGTQCAQPVAAQWKACSALVAVSQVVANKTAERLWEVWPPWHGAPWRTESSCNLLLLPAGTSTDGRPLTSYVSASVKAGGAQRARGCQSAAASSLARSSMAAASQPVSQG